MMYEHIPPTLSFVAGGMILTMIVLCILLAYGFWKNLTGRFRAG